MSILRYFTTKPGLPNPDAEGTNRKLFISASQQVETEIKKTLSRKRGNYGQYSDEMKAKVAKYACLNGNAAAKKHYGISESTIRSFKSSYQKLLKDIDSRETVDRIPHKTRGRPVKLGNLDADVINYITKLREAGGIVNRSIVIAAATGIVKFKQPNSLHENGGHLELGRKWAESLMSRMGLVRRKATKAARKLPLDFEFQKENYLHRIEKYVREHNIPESLVINLDQTGVKFVPVSCWTMANEGSKQVPVVGIEDKRELTMVFAVSAAGEMLFPQVIYAGKTPACHAKIDFPEGWHIYHSTNHWSNEDTMSNYVDIILIPYIANVKQENNLADDQKALLILDVFAAHRCESFKSKLTNSGIIFTYVPVGCTGELQPLDLTVNEQFKKKMKDCFTTWYAEQVSDALREGEDLSEIKVDLRTSVIKPIHAKWIIDSTALVSQDTTNIQLGFRKAGIASVLKQDFNSS